MALRLLVLADQAPFLPLASLVATHRPDAVVALGDLEPDELDPLGRFDVPVLGVYGNHDDGRYLEAANATDLHLATASLGGLRFAGFQGSPRYRRGAKLQYSQAEASKLAKRIPDADVLVTHAPPRGVHEEPDDRAHEGFDALRAYVERVRPRLHLHGHTPAPPRADARIGPTTVVHVVGHRLLVL
jgi:Icc-related predicted phosphoesterase